MTLAKQSLGTGRVFTRYRLILNKITLLLREFYNSLRKLILRPIGLELHRAINLPHIRLPILIGNVVKPWLPSHTNDLGLIRKLRLFGRLNRLL
jgi:hypothetical protein